ncbi:hypothetical protein CCYS_13350 [Corynebacterium cystitidis DSM 20524]|uniref:Uncharacterized protein n=1 Tax=Corynebacterium cystitidis DSM 20524 TaxID=1121357 RepID=A0A1H9TC40_9CORY|nr:hypothetical protein CCYS_13350 [Corynebacterium cystitidis DSM 20524]SER94782.1 hypothetical protein SAMN05661109_01410 [Corynebacterium cystitidis DSM 20524]SNV92118.1 Uncharacterised protein [Corynebacterium cystitidis]
MSHSVTFSQYESKSGSVSCTVAVEITNEAQLVALIATLRRRGGDCATVELKSAQGGVPEDLPRTLSAFANMLPVD